MENLENNKNCDKSKHYKKFLEEHQELIHTSVNCPICGGSYTYFNKSRHNKSPKHIKFIPLYEELQKIEDEKDKIIFKLKNKMKV